MPEHFFDTLIRSLARSASRRQAMGTIAGLFAALATPGTRRAYAHDQSQGSPVATSSPSAATPVATPDPGALIRTSVDGLVGVLLEDVPPSLRDDYAAEILVKPDEWWVNRAGRQLALSNYRLIYRAYYYDETKGNLPLPPAELWQIDIDPAGPTRTAIDGHDVVAVAYHFSSTLFSDGLSPAVSEPLLADIGGVWQEMLVFPVDPLHIVQRTGNACMDEAEYPPETVSDESAHELYDDTCDVEDPAEPSCHFSEPYPTESCVDAVIRAVGHVETAIVFERLAWDPVEAETWRVGAPTTVDTPDSMVVSDESGLALNHTVFRYFSPEHCAAVEGCIGAPGWRRLINFNAKTHNVGGGDMVFGEIDYANEGFTTELIDHNVYQFAPCHGHYHFQHYGLFTFDAPGALENNKNGFCIESTDRLSNNESTSLVSPYSCYNQGTPSGWGDTYISSIVCNWVDVTDVATIDGPVTAELAFEFNPGGFLCEGTVALDDQGNRTWEPTEFTTPDGAIVSRPACNVTPGTDENNRGTTQVTLPARGGTMSQPCRDDQSIGPLRNCGFTMSDTFLACDAGSPVTVTCTAEGPVVEGQVLRFCETSAALGTGVDCWHSDALANVIFEEPQVVVEMPCPASRDAGEPGGAIAVYVAPISLSGQTARVTCKPNE